MAEHKHGEMDTTAQEKTFHDFMVFTKWTVIVLFLIVIFLAIVAI